MAQSDPNDDTKTRKELLEEHPDVLAVYEYRGVKLKVIEIDPNDPNKPPYKYVSLAGKQSIIGSICERYVFDHYPVESAHTHWRDGIDKLFMQDSEMKGTRIQKKDGKRTKPGRFICWRAAHKKLKENGGCYFVVVYQVDPTEDGEGMLLSVLACERIKPDDMVHLADEAGTDGFKWTMNTNKQGGNWHAQIRWDWVIDEDIERVYPEWQFE